MNVERATLLVLTASPRAITPQIIAGMIGQFTATPVTLTDIRQTLSRLEGKGHAKGTVTMEEDEHGHSVVVWIATPDGRLRVS